MQNLLSHWSLIPEAHSVTGEDPIRANSKGHYGAFPRARKSLSNSKGKGWREKPWAEISWEVIVSEGRAAQSTDSDTQDMSRRRERFSGRGCNENSMQYRSKEDLPWRNYWKLNGWKYQKVLFSLDLTSHLQKIVFTFKVCLETFACDRVDCVVWGGKAFGILSVWTRLTGVGRGICSQRGAGVGCSGADWNMMRFVVRWKYWAGTG